MEGIRHGSALTFAAAIVAALAVSACSSAPPHAPVTLTPTLAPYVSNSITATASPDATDPPASDDIPATPMTTSAVALAKPQRGSSAPVGAVVFGTDVSSGGHTVTVTGQRTTFAAGHPIAWRVTLPAAIGGESVRVTMTTADNAETLVDEFVAQAGWNVYYGKSVLTLAPGTYVLHYLVDGHEVGSGTFKIKASADVGGPTPSPLAALPAPTSTVAPTASPRSGTN